MNPKIVESNIAELEAQINALKFKNSNLELNALELQTNVIAPKTSNQLLSKKSEWLETELAMSKHHCALFNNSIYGKSSEKSNHSHTEQMSLLFNEAEAYVKDEEDNVVSEPEPKTHKKGGHKCLPKGLPREKIIHELKRRIAM